MVCRNVHCQPLFWGLRSAAKLHKKLSWEADWVPKVVSHESGIEINLSLYVHWKLHDLMFACNILTSHITTACDVCDTTYIRSSLSDVWNASIGSKRDIKNRVCHIWWAAVGVCEYWRSPNNSWPVNINYRWLSVSRILALHDLLSIVFKSCCDVHTGNKHWQSMTRSSSFSRHLSHHWRKFSGNVSGNFQPSAPVRISLDSKQCRCVMSKKLEWSSCLLL